MIMFHVKLGEKGANMSSKWKPETSQQTTLPTLDTEAEVENHPRAIMLAIIAHGLLAKNVTMSAIPKQARELVDNLLAEA